MSRLTAHSLLLLTAFIWGITFVFQATGMENMGAFGFMFFRFLTGSIGILPLALWESRRISLIKEMQSAPSDLKPLAIGVISLGGLMFLGSMLQQVSLGITSVANTAFLTTLYVPLVPLLGLMLFRHQMPRLRWVAVGIFVVGSWLMSGASPAEAVMGDTMVVIGAVFWAAHIMLVGWLVRRTKAPFQLAFIQTFITMILSYLVFAATESITMDGLVSALPEILFAGILSTALGFTLQLAAQQYCSNAAAAIILSLEGVFAALAGWVILGQSMLASAMLGAGLIFAAVLLVELTPQNTHPKTQKPQRKKT